LSQYEATSFKRSSKVRQKLFSISSQIQSFSGHPIKGGRPQIISWIAQTFLQLVLLSIIIVGQNVLATASDKRAEATYEDADAVLHTALQIQDHLAAQDAEIEKIIARLKTT